MKNLTCNGAFLILITLGTYVKAITLELPIDYIKEDTERISGDISKISPNSRLWNVGWRSIYYFNTKDIWDVPSSPPQLELHTEKDRFLTNFDGMITKIIDSAKSKPLKVRNFTLSIGHTGTEMMFGLEPWEFNAPIISSISFKKVLETLVSDKNLGLWKQHQNLSTYLQSQNLSELEKKSREALEMIHKFDFSYRKQNRVPVHENKYSILSRRENNTTYERSDKWGWSESDNSKDILFCYKKDKDNLIGKIRYNQSEDNYTIEAFKISSILIEDLPKAYEIAIKESTKMELKKP